MNTKEIEQKILEIIAKGKQVHVVEIATEFMQIDKNFDMRVLGDVLAKLLRDGIIRQQGLNISLLVEKYDTNKKL